jgi:hypothetical protein
MVRIPFAGLFIESEVPEVLEASTKMPELLRNWQAIYHAARSPVPCLGDF